MKQKVFFILALLLMAATSAWAQTPTLLTTIEAADNSDFTSGSKTFDNIATVTFSADVEHQTIMGWFRAATGVNSETTITVTPVEGNTITSCKFYTTSESAEDTQSPFEINMKEEEGTYFVSFFVNGNEIGGSGVTKIEVYGYKATKNAVALAEGTEDAANWTIDPASADAGEQVTLKYNGLMKVESITAVKKEAVAVARTLAEATAADLGKIAGADGNIYDTKDAAEAAGTTAVAMIAYVGSETDHATYKHGLAIGLDIEKLNGEIDLQWDAAKSVCEGKTAVPGAAWLLPSENQWRAMFKAFGNNESSKSGLNTALSNAGAETVQAAWTSVEDGDDAKFLDNSENIGFSDRDKGQGLFTRSCLVF